MQGSPADSAAPIDVLVVDGANVVGSRPDGWWRDRPGAAARLHAQLGHATVPARRVVLVLEGRAKAGVPESTGDDLQVVHAPGEGDGAIVATVERAALEGGAVAVVTADRALAARVQQLGARVLGPRWLLEQLPTPPAAAR